MGPEFQLPVTEAEYEKAGSKFAQVGNHLSECTGVDWDTPGKSIKFDFQIVEGPNEGIEGKISAGVEASGIWKLKELLKALGVEMTMVKGKPQFKSEDCIGKQFLTVWSEQVDSRSIEEGGKGTKYTKPTGALLAPEKPAEEKAKA